MAPRVRRQVLRGQMLHSRAARHPHTPPHTIATHNETKSCWYVIPHMQPINYTPSDQTLPPLASGHVYPISTHPLLVAKNRASFFF